MSKGRGSARTPKKNRPTPRRVDAERRNGRHSCTATDDLWDVEAALIWLARHPERLPVVTAARDAAVAAVMVDRPSVLSGDDDAAAVAYLTRMTLCAAWIADERTRSTEFMTPDGPIGWDELAQSYDVAVVVAVWREERAHRLADHSHREAQRELRLVRTPGDIPPAGTP